MFQAFQRFLKYHHAAVTPLSLHKNVDIMPLSGKSFHRILMPYVVNYLCEELFVTVMLFCRYVGLRYRDPIVASCFCGRMHRLHHMNIIQMYNTTHFTNMKQKITTHKEHQNGNVSIKLKKNIQNKSS